MKIENESCPALASDIKSVTALPAISWSCVRDDADHMCADAAAADVPRFLAYFLYGFFEAKNDYIDCVCLR